MLFGVTVLLYFMKKRKLTKKAEIFRNTQASDWEVGTIEPYNIH